MKSCLCFSRSLSSSLCSFFFSLCSSLSSLLFSYLLCYSFIDFLLCFQFLSNCILLSLSLVFTNCINALCLCSLPCIELLLCSSLVKSALLHTTAEVLHHVNAFSAQDVTNCVCWLCAILYAVECSFEIQIYSSVIGVRMVRTNLLSAFTIP